MYNFLLVAKFGGKVVRQTMTNYIGH